MRKYDKYKNTNIEWIGEIPEHWVIKQLRYVSSQISAGGTPSTKVEKYWNQNDYVWLPSGRVQNKEIVITNKEKYISQSGLENSSTKLIDPNTTLIALTGATCGNIGYLTFKACANQSVVSINNNETFDSKFLFYYLLSQREQIRLKQSGGAQGGINTEDVKSLKFVSPSIEEQIQISSYLDNKTSLIDRLINNNKKLIKLLEEKRTALINKVITKGLDPNVKMKDSGIEWIGEIPEHWEVKKLKYLLEKNDSGVWGEEPSDMSGVRVLRSTEISINGKLINIERAAYRQLSKEEKLKSKLQKGDLLVTKSSGSKKHIGKTALMDSVVESEPTYFSNFMQLLRTNNQLLPRFCHLFLNSDITRYQYNLLANTTTGLANLNRRHFDNLTISVPPISEQIQISSYLDNKTSLIDKAIIKAKEENLMLKEYRQSLISNVITGKIDVRNN